MWGKSREGIKDSRRWEDSNKDFIGNLVKLCLCCILKKNLVDVECIININLINE